LYGQDVDLHWHVVETSAIVNEARGRLENSESSKLKFYDNIESAAKDFGKIDMVFTSGVLQYVPEPCEYLRRLVELGASFLFITRTALANNGPDKIIIQNSYLRSNGPGPLPLGVTDCILSYPVTFVPQENFEQILRSKYLIELKIAEDKSAYRAAGEPIDMYGYFCSKIE